MRRQLPLSGRAVCGVIGVPIAIAVLQRALLLAAAISLLALGHFHWVSCVRTMASGIAAASAYVVWRGWVLVGPVTKSVLRDWKR